MRFVMRASLALLAILVLFVAVVVIRTVTFRSETKAVAPVDLAPAPEVDVA